MGSAWTIFLLSRLMPCWACSASLISLLVTAPNSFPPAPARAEIFTMAFSRAFAFSMACSFSAAILAAFAFSRSFKALRLSFVASTASFRGSR